jgi:hypothetical protein
VTEDDRGQVVLLAAGLVAVALVAMLLAYLQVVAVGGAGATADRPSVTATDATRGLEAAVANATASVPADARDDPAAVRTRFDATLATDVSTLRAGWEREGTLVGVARNRTVADAWARDDCPRGELRRFGACIARDGVVVQERVGEWYVVAVALDVRVTAPERSTRVTVVVRP